MNSYIDRLARDLAAKRIRWSKGVGLSYVKGRDWDDLIDAGKVEYAEDVVEDE